jgi:hypothetical protein
MREFRKRQLGRLSNSGGIKMTIRKNIFGAALPFAMLVAASSAQAQTGVGFSPGAVFDMLSWSAFVSVVQPAPPFCPQGTVMFETWASDAQTFTTPPVWPTCGNAGGVRVASGRQGSRFQPSLLGSAHLSGGLTADAFTVPCGPPSPFPLNPAAGNFPTPALASPPTNCVAEQVVRNRASFDYITQNGLNTQSGLRQAFTQAAPIWFPPEAIEVKIQWVPVPTMVSWLSANGVNVTPAFVTQNYFITKDDNGYQYAMTSMHITTKQFPNWLWANFEHQMNPGRCDTMGCYDQFGVPAPLASIAPAAAPNTQYPACAKSPQLAALFNAAQLSGVWQNYCLKATQLTFVSPAGQPVLDGDSVIERITGNTPIASSSCITCHYYAAFNNNGQTCASTPGLLTNPIGNVTPQSGQKMYDFVWGLLAIPGQMNGQC